MGKKTNTQNTNPQTDGKENLNDSLQVKEEIANEMALSKFRRLMHSESKRSKDPLKYARLDWRTTLLLAIVVILLISAMVFTIVMHFRSKEKEPDVQGNTVAITEEGNSENNPVPENAGQNGNIQASYTGVLSESASEYEGREGTGEYNYGEALQKSLLFYELQRSGDLPDNTRCNWRADSGMSDGADVGLDLTGGLYDAGDHVKFNLPMAYTASTLAWSVYEDYESYEESGQLDYILDTIRWINDYMMKCHPEKDVFYYQVGDGSADHSWWGPAEVMTMNRPSYKVDRSSPGATVTAAAAASLASASVILRESDPDYASLCMQHAEELFAFANETRSDSGYTAANGFYNSHSGFYDELAWAGIWLYIATGEIEYLDVAGEGFNNANKDYKWMHCWDDVSLGAAVLLAEKTKDPLYSNHVEKCLDYWTTGVNGERITYTPKGLAWLDSWGALRYSTTAAFVAAVYSDSDMCTPDKKQTYWDFALAQVNYALGSTGFSYQIGFSTNYPQNPHHRTAQGSYCNNMNEPNEARHTLYGALVGGPDSNDNYSDDVSNYVNNEVACDYNAGFTGALAHLYKTYGGKTLVDFGAVEPVLQNEISVNACVNTQGADHTEVKAYVMNTSAWPARTLSNVTIRYFMNLSEIYNEGGSVADVSLSINYSQGGNVAGIYPWNEAEHIYYAEISFGDTQIYPGGQDSYKKEIQFRMSSDSVWDSSNDYSYIDISGTDGGSLKESPHITMYENGTLIYGAEPSEEGIDNGSKPVISSGQEPPSEQPDEVDLWNHSQQVEQDGLSLGVENNSVSGDGSTISVFFTLKNTGKESIDLSKIRIEYFFSADGNQKMNFWCDYSAISGNNYEAVTDMIKGEVVSVTTGNDEADTKIVITTTGVKELKTGEEWTVQIRVAREDWSNMKFSNDYSAKGADKTVVYYGEKAVIGEAP